MWCGWGESSRSKSLEWSERGFLEWCVRYANKTKKLVINMSPSTWEFPFGYGCWVFSFTLLSALCSAPVCAEYSSGQTPCLAASCFFKKNLRFRLLPTTHKSVRIKSGSPFKHTSMYTRQIFPILVPILA
jgi:hypothetical protein